MSSIWLDSNFMNFQNLDKNLDADVCIIGAGI